MKKWIVSLIFIILLVLTALFIPRHTEQGLIIYNDKDYSIIYVNGVKQRVKTSGLNFQPGTVVNYNFNIFTAYNFKEVKPVIDRVLIKKGSNYDLEKFGDTSLSKKIVYYTFNPSLKKEDAIKLCNSSSLIIGQSNIKLYKDSKNKIKTVLIPPMDYINTKIRVGISSTNFSSIYHDKLQVYCDSPAKLYSIRDNINIELPKNTLITSSLNGNTINVDINGSIKSFNNRIYISSESMILKSIERGSPSFYPHVSGVLEIYKADKGMVLTNETEIEEYLRGVVPSEMPSYAPMEALKCQSVSARTYAISDMLQGRFSSLGFHVDDSTNCQVFNNVIPQNSTDKAIKETKGIILTYNNSPIDAKFYSTSCGTGARFEDIWFRSDGTSEKKPYLITSNYLSSNKSLPSNEDEWFLFFKDFTVKSIDSKSKYYRWTSVCTTNELSSILGKNLKSLYADKTDYIDIYKKNRNIFSFPDLNALTNISVSKRGTGGNVMEISFDFGDIKIKVKGDTNIRRVLKLPSILNTKDESLMSNVLPSSFFSVEKSSDSKYLFYGGGYGHGVGMSQYGAIELANRKMKYEEILGVYYYKSILKPIGSL